MSGGSPVAGSGFGSMRQRQRLNPNGQGGGGGYVSSGDELEDDDDDDAFSKTIIASSKRTWLHLFLWIASSIFIIYSGDRKSNFIHILFHDHRISRIPLYLGMIGVSLNAMFFLYTSMLAWGFRKSSEKWEISNIAALPFVTMLGLISFCLFSFALWPIWRFLTLPLVFTLFMACMVILPYLVLGTCSQQADVPRTD